MTNCIGGLNNYAQYYKPKDTAAGNASSGKAKFYIISHRINENPNIEFAFFI